MREEREGASPSNAEIKGVSGAISVRRFECRSTLHASIQRGNHIAIQQMVGTLQRIDQGNIVWNPKGIENGAAQISRCPRRVTG